MRTIILGLLFTGLLAAQFGSSPVRAVSTAPSGACGNNTAQLVAPGGLFFTCQNGFWTQLSGAGGGLPSTQPNQVIAGPASGSSPATAAPRALVVNDIPGGLPYDALNAAAAAQSAATAAFTGDVGKSASSFATVVNGLKGVPFCTGFTPTNGQSLQYSTALSPNPCYTAAAGGNLTQISIGAISAVPACNSSTFLFFPNNSFYTSVVGDGSNCHYYITGMERFPVVAASWAWSNQNGNTETTNGASTLTILDTGTTVQWSGKTLNLPHASPYTYTGFMYPLAAAQSTQTMGFWITDGTKQIHVEAITSTASGCTVRVEHIASSTDGGTGFANSSVLPNGACTGAIELGLRIADSGSALSYYYSLDRGVSWVQIGSTESSTGFLTATKIGYGGVSVTSGTESRLSMLVTSAQFQ
jgi:hypothetical protein